MDFKRPGVGYQQWENVPAAGGSRGAIEEYARRVSSALELKPGGSLLDVVKALHGRVHYVDLDRFVDVHTGAIYVHAKNDFDIILPNYTSPLRDRFTLGHELGHYFLHSRQGMTPIIAMRQGSGVREQEANWFSAELVMPAVAFKERFHLSGGDINDLASAFEVSTDAASVRARVLGLS